MFISALFIIIKKRETIHLSFSGWMVQELGVQPQQKHPSAIGRLQLLLHTAWTARRRITRRDRHAWAHFQDLPQDKITGCRTQQWAPSAGKRGHDYKRAGGLGDDRSVPCVDCSGGYSTLCICQHLKLHVKWVYLLCVNYTSREKKNKWASSLC